MVAAGSAGSSLVPASRLEGIVLLTVAWLAVIAAGLLAPVLPGMAVHYRDVPARDLLIGFVATGPALLVMLCSLPFGWLADRVGGRTVLIGGMLGYGICGTAPLWLQSLPAIAFSRAAMGVCESAAMTAGTAMIGLAFPPATRGRWLAAQVGSANVMGIVTAMIGGWTGQWSWRAPFWAYAFPFLMLPLVVLTVRERRVTPAMHEGPLDHDPRRVRLLVIRSLFATLAGLLLIALMVETSFLLAARGITDSSLIGLCIAAAAVGTTIGAMISAALIRSDPALRIACGFGTLALGFFGILLFTSVVGTAVGGFVGGLGIGLIVPGLLAVIVGGVPEHERGRAAGAFTGAFALGQFVSPPAFVALAQAGLGVETGMLIAGIASGIMVPIILCGFRRTLGIAELTLAKAGTGT
jgi:MFS family permease